MVGRFCLTLVLFTLLTPLGTAQGTGRIPGPTWERYLHPAEAGFDPDRLAAAQESWEALPSSAFLVVADGAVVAAWGEPQRRFLCHSVRKSFLAALYGIYWDRGEIELNKTLEDLGIDDEPDPLLDSEKQARILDLLKARSGVFHPAAYAGRTDSRPRGSEGPGRFFAYNNWDFNTLVTILEQETGERVFEAFDEHFGRPLGMQDWRVSDGYYHYERDKSRHPAYPFRMSARDAARFGLLYARKGRWGDRQILSSHWVDRCGALYSIDSEVMGYGFMWWVMREERFARHGMICALGVGNQMIAALPESDLVIVNRANTYEGENTPLSGLLDLIEEVLAARTGEPIEDPRLAPLPDDPPPFPMTPASAEALAAFEGDFVIPPPALGLSAERQVSVKAGPGHLIGHAPRGGTFAIWLQADGSLRSEDSHDVYLPIHDAEGNFLGPCPVDSIVNGAVEAAAMRDDREAAEALLAHLDRSAPSRAGLARALIEVILTGDLEGAADAVHEGLGPGEGPRFEARVNNIGYHFLGDNQPERACALFELNTELFPASANAWDSLAEANLRLGDEELAVLCYQQSLELNPDNQGAKAALERLGVPVD